MCCDRTTAEPCLLLANCLPNLNQPGNETGVFVPELARLRACAPRKSPVTIATWIVALAGGLTTSGRRANFSFLWPDLFAMR